VDLKVEKTAVNVIDAAAQARATVSTWR